MNIKKQEQGKQRAEMSAAVAAHQHKVRQVLQEAVDGGFMTEQELERCVEHADGSRWGDTDHSRRERPEATNIDVVWSTYDYNAFSLMDEGLNRGVDHWLTIVKSMARCPMMSPIIVNGNLEIIDGQNRFFARRYLGLPIEYIIKSDYGVVQARNYNTSHKNWTKSDFVSSYSAEGVESYVLLEQLYLKYPKIPKSVIDVVATKGVAANPNQVIQSGQLEMDAIEKREKVCNLLMEYATSPNYMTPSHMIIESTKWCRAWLTIYFNNPDFDPRRLRRNAIANPSYLYPSATVKDTCEMMEKLYNRRCQPVKLKY